MKFSEPLDGGPCWVALSTSDIPAAKSFYAALFGWRCETDPRAEAGGSTVARLGEAAVASLGPVPRTDRSPAWTVFFSTGDTDTTVERVTSAGGTLLAGPMDVFEQGRSALVADPEGAVFSLWQPRTFAGAERLNDPGALGWVELSTRDTVEALAFYPSVLGWTVNAAESYTHWGVDGADFGGMMAMDERFEPEVPPYWLPYFVVTDVDSTAATALSAGGDLLLAPISIPDGPRIAVLRDPQGATFGIHKSYGED
ncbi:VOC family protein [Streptomyces finlayi]|uniref:VOC family protein n=1 Tax=Streptomyces finlayi TaxID=67296 RepID=A0A7G7BEH4_9ACTN|nr:VOC family protein [Streptomyces finlayi]QNE73739.1 VOC family protein [Streptomyces finlayi]